MSALFCETTVLVNVLHVRNPLHICLLAIYRLGASRLCASSSILNNLRKGNSGFKYLSPPTTHTHTHTHTHTQVNSAKEQGDHDKARSSSRIAKWLNIAGIITGSLLLVGLVVFLIVFATVIVPNSFRNFDITPVG